MCRPTAWPLNRLYSGRTASGLPNGVPRTIVGTGTVDGLDYIDIRYNGTPTGTGANTIVFEPAVTVAIGEIWSLSIFVALVGGALTNVSGFTLRAGGEGGTNYTPNATLTRWTDTQVRSATAGALTLRWNWTALAAVDVTFRFAAPQRTLGAQMLPPIRTSA